MTTIMLFTHPTCSPCKAMREVLRTMDLPDGVKIREVDVAKEPEVGTRYAVRSFPTMIVLDGNDQTLDTHVGLASQAKVRELIAAA